MTRTQDRFDALDQEPHDQWLVPPWETVRDEDKLDAGEFALLEEVIRKRAPHLLEQLKVLGVRVQKPSERERLRDVVLDELVEFGVDYDRLNAYGRDLDNLIWKLGRF